MSKDNSNKVSGKKPRSEDFDDAVKDYEEQLESDSSIETAPKQSKSKSSKKSDSDAAKVKKSKKKKVADSDDSDVEVQKKKFKRAAASDVETKSKSKSKKDASKASKSKSKTVAMTEEKMKPTKGKKINPKNNLVEDPSTTTKTSENKYPLVYNGKTYYCKSLPEHFQEQWDGICKMRKSKDAPIDTLGPSKLADPNEDPATQRFQILVAVILSAQTPDERTASAVTNLKNHGLTVASMNEIHPDDLYKMVKTVAFNTGKVKYIKETAKILRDSYNSDVPRTKAEIQALPGCGPKVANLVMWVCWNEITGIAIDTNMERIFGKRLMWSSYAKREKQMKDLESWMPKAMWPDLNEKIVGFGQTYCKTKSPNCQECLINKTCDYYRTQF